MKALLNKLEDTRALVEDWKQKDKKAFNTDSHDDEFVKNFTEEREAMKKMKSAVRSLANSCGFKVKKMEFEDDWKEVFDSLDFKIKEAYNRFCQVPDWSGKLEEK